MSEKEENEKKFLTLHLAAEAQINGFMTGPDDMFLGLEIIDDDGNKVLAVFRSPKAITALYEAIGNAQNMTLIRNMKVFNMLHDEVGCPQAHEIMARSLEDLIDPPQEVAETKKVNLTLVKH